MFKHYSICQFQIDTDICSYTYMYMYMYVHVHLCMCPLALVINPRRACAGGLRYLSCVSVCYDFFGYIFHFYAGIQIRYRLCVIFNSLIFDKPFRSKVMARKSQYANEQLPLATGFSPFRVPCIHQ